MFRKIIVSSSFHLIFKKPGNPKGVVVTHIAFVRTVESIHIVLKVRYDYDT